MAKVRVRAWIENCGNGMYRVRSNDGAHTNPSFDLASLQKHVDYINNEDADDPRYIYVDDPSEDSAEEERRQLEWKMMKERERRYNERKQKEEEKKENNRKNHKTSDKFVYVISCVQRGCKTTDYFKGITDLMKLAGVSFVTPNDKEAKTFKTKASAQKVADVLTKVYLVRKVYRNIKVVQKRKEIFE